jgi:hypothetical protein
MHSGDSPATPANGTAPEPDIWSSGRETQRAEVQAAFAPRPRSCPHCGHTQTSGAARCEACGGEMVVRRQKMQRRRIALIAGLVIAGIAAAGLAFVPGLRESASEHARAQAERQARLEAAERRFLLAEAQPKTAPAPARRAAEGVLEHRRRLVAAGEAAITADARRRVAAGTVDGPIAGTRCSPYPKIARRIEQETDPSLPANRYQCIAYEKRVELSELDGRERTGIYGTPFWLVIDYRKPAMTFCRVALRPGEGGKPLAKIEMPAVCLDPLRER